MRPLRRAPSRCDITLLTPLFSFLFVPKTFYKRNGKKKKHQCKHCNYYYYCSVTGSTTITCTTAFFHISILSTDLFLVGEWQLLRDYKLKKGRGWGGAEHLLHGIFCTFSWIAFCLFEYEEVFGRRRKQDMRRSVEHEDLERRKLKTAAEDLRG